MPKSSFLRFNSGILANLENSSTILRISSVCRVITSTICLRVFESSLSNGLNFFLILSADNCIGVRGFFISWAILLATSPQAADLCAETRLVISSKATT